MYVVKRDGHKEPVMFDKITDRIKKLCYGLNDLVDAVKVAMRVIEGLYDGVSTSELDNLAAETAASMTIAHPDYAQLAARIAISNLHSNTKKSFSETMSEMYHYVNPRNGQEAPLLSEEVHNVIQENAEFLAKFYEFMALGISSSDALYKTKFYFANNNYSPTMWGAYIYYGSDFYLSKKNILNEYLYVILIILFCGLAVFVVFIKRKLKKQTN